jgi:cyclopropane fatty-acyl-phospholipid synthase-like methyltransferase
MDGQSRNTKWFEDWFDSKYYHILYQNRDEAEAQRFVENLMNKLSLPQGSRILDLACGAGRHSIHLNELGYDVIGLDLSEESINQARKFENETLEFYVHDMRELYWDNYFDAVLNLFTSFGYFESDEEHQKTIDSVASALKRDGIFVLDFMNAEKVKANLVLEEKKTLDDITFHILRRQQEGKIIKRIDFSDGDENFTFEEKVRAFNLEELESMMDNSDLKVEEVFGNYDLAPFDEESSDRLIILARKI